MSYEAVPCMFRNPGPNGENEMIGFLVRKTANNSRTTQNNSQPPPPPPLLVQGDIKPGAPIRGIGADNTSKLLVPAKLQLRVATTSVPTAPLAPVSSWSSAMPSRMASSNFPASHMSMTSPSQLRSVSVCSSSPMAESSSPMSPVINNANSAYRGVMPMESRSGRTSRQWQPSLVSDSSTTPDSGIQSITSSPPCTTLSPPCNEASEELQDEDFTDMPRLVPAGQEDDCQPGPSGMKEENLSTNGSECETAPVPSISITPSMDSKEIVEQLFQFDAEKITAIANLLRMKAEDSKRKSDQNETVVPSKKPRSASAASDDLRKSEEESRYNSPLYDIVDLTECTSAAPETSPKTPEPTQETKVEDKEGKEDLRDKYRLATQKFLNMKLAMLLDKTRESIEHLRLGDRDKRERRINKNVFQMVDLNRVLNKKKKEEAEEKKLSKRADRKRSHGNVGRPRKMKRQQQQDDQETKKMKSLSSSQPTVENQADKTDGGRASRTTVRTAEKIESTSVASDKKKEMEYEEIKRSFCENSRLSWGCPIVSCACTKGSCSSDAECVNRALCVQCPLKCRATLCVNKKFWKEDVVRQLVASGPRSKRVLKTKLTRRAGDFMGEYAGEIISYEEAVSRTNSYIQEGLQPCILAMSSMLFIDSTKYGNLTRYVKHSCKPNSRIEVWSINGHRRAGLFSLFNIASGSEITIDMSFLLPTARTCSCGFNKCKNIIKPSRNAIIANKPPLSSEEKTIVTNHRLFLIRNFNRNRKAAKETHFPSTSEVPSTEAGKIRRIFHGLQQRIRRVDGSMPLMAVREYSMIKDLLKDASADNTLELFQSIVDKWLEKLNDDDFDRCYGALSSLYLSATAPKIDKRKERFVNREVDLAYVTNTNPVGSYDPDDAWPSGSTKENDDAVRCDCGSLEEDGEMLQCDGCHFWLHTDCVGKIDSNKEYKCKFCIGKLRIPCADVLLEKQPKIRLDGCKYYKSLRNERKIQVRLNETVYVEQVDQELMMRYKKLLKKMENQEKASKKRRDSDDGKLAGPLVKVDPKTKHFDRMTLRVFRVDRLFTTPTGHQFVFGFYYARPHETICDLHRQFHRNEVFATPFYDTLPLDAVVGRCCVLDPDVWSMGRPLIPLFKEEDVFICEYQIDSHQRSFEKIPAKNKFPINIHQYAFNRFPHIRPLSRDFTPFVIDSSNGRHSRTEHKVDKKTEEGRWKAAADRLDEIASKLTCRSDNKRQK